MAVDNSMKESAVVIDGKATSVLIQKEELTPACSAFLECHRRQVGLAVVVVGTRKDSATYVRMKQKACAAVGIQSWKIQIDVPDAAVATPSGAGSDQAQAAVVEQIYATVDSLNARDDVDGIIVQLPLPAFCEEEKILGSIDPAKDVDGLHPKNRAAMLEYATTKASKDEANQPLKFSVPCTPAGCIELLDRYHIPLEGKRVVVLGRSQIVGLPVALLCMHRNATVTICHSRTQDLAERVKEADIVIAAIGRARFVQGDWIKPGATVIDVGINTIDDASKKAGYRLVGDVAFDEAIWKAYAITPVPGGVGPMTVAMLLRNTVHCARRRMQS